MSHMDDELDRLAESAFGPLRPGQPRPIDAQLVETFRKVGLSQEAAESAARGLAGGIYFNLEDAAISSAAFDIGPRGSFLDYARLREVAKRHSGTVVAERRTATKVRPRVIESGRGTVSGNGTLSIVLIDAGTGSSGIYPSTTLEAAGKSRVFGKGLQMFLDHPTATEQYDRPERSVRDLAGVLASDAWYDTSDQALKATATVFAPFREAITEMAPHIGLSIRAEAQVSPSDQGPLVQEITRALSVDFVTQAGRGGRIVSAV